jgi:Fe2+ or Zn2+ uptake regulation protein
MDELLNLVLQETQRLCDEGPEAGYEAFVWLTDLREKMMEVLAEQQEALTNEHKAIIRRLLELDPVILGHMQTLKHEAEQGLLRIQQSNKQREAYQQHYDVGSIMFDRKK